MGTCRGCFGMGRWDPSSETTLLRSSYPFGHHGGNDIPASEKCSCSCSFVTRAVVSRRCFQHTYFARNRSQIFILHAYPLADIWGLSISWWRAMTMMITPAHEFATLEQQPAIDDRTEARQ